MQPLPTPTCVLFLTLFAFPVINSMADDQASHEAGKVLMVQFPFNYRWQLKNTFTLRFPHHEGEFLRFYWNKYDFDQEKFRPANCVINEIDNFRSRSRNDPILPAKLEITEQTGRECSINSDYLDDLFRGDLNNFSVLSAIDETEQGTAHPFDTLYFTSQQNAKAMTSQEVIHGIEAFKDFFQHFDSTSTSAVHQCPWYRLDCRLLAWGNYALGYSSPTDLTSTAPSQEALSQEALSQEALLTGDTPSYTCRKYRPNYQRLTSRQSLQKWMPPFPLDQLTKSYFHTENTYICWKKTPDNKVHPFHGEL